MKQLRNENRTADRVPGIIEAEQIARQTPHIINKRIRVQIVVPVVPITAAVKLVGAALGDERNLRASIASVFRLICARKDLKLRRRVEAHRDVLTAVRPRVDITNAVDRELVFRAAVAVDKEPV